MDYLVSTFSDLILPYIKSFFPLSNCKIPYKYDPNALSKPILNKWSKIWDDFRTVRWDELVEYPLVWNEQVKELLAEFGCTVEPIIEHVEG
jgi:hypothetical protein